MERETEFSPRKRPRQKRSRQTVDALLLATARVLVEEGYDRTTTNRIAEVAGVSIGSLYQYFPNKESLLAALIEEHEAQVKQVLMSELAATVGLSLEDGARALVVAVVAAHRVNPELHRVIHQQLPNLHLDEYVEEFENFLISNVLTYLQLRATEVRPGNLEMAAFVLVHAVQALMDAALVRRPAYTGDDEFVAEVAALIVGYLRPQT